MKLSEYKGEDALDLLADILEPASEIMTDKVLVDMVRNGKNPINAVQRAIKNHKKSVLQIMATMEGVPVEEYECSFFSLPIKLLELANDKELIKFFSMQGQTEPSVTSGSAMEITEALEK
ncbi:MAG: hypothetical protein MJZ26_12255 [Fibrobacter sp.]|nr:hypothetical protein [Fibrobacter sp.]